MVLFDLATGRLKHSLRPDNGGTNAVAFSPDGKRLTLAGVDRSLTVWDVSGGERLVTWASPALVEALAFSPDGSQVAAADSGNHN